MLLHAAALHPLRHSRANLTTMAIASSSVERP
jgi:hypothetical protein